MGSNTQTIYTKIYRSVGIESDVFSYYKIPNITNSFEKRMLKMVSSDKLASYANKTVILITKAVLVIYMNK